MKSANRTVTLKDIAKEAGITVAAVSRALKDSDDIGEETKKNVQKIARKFGYTTNHIASSLRTGKSKILGLLVSDNSNPFVARLFKGVENVARSKGYTVFLINTDENPDQERDAISTMVSLRVGAILAIPVDLNNYTGIMTPLIFLARYYGKKDLEEYDYVVNDDIKGMIMAVRHMLEQDRPLYFINGPQAFGPAKTRLEGFKKGLKELEKPFIKKNVINETVDIEGGYRGFGKLKESILFPCSIICFCDYMALGVLKAIRESGWDVPKDIRLLGYDDIEYLEYQAVPLTSIKQAKYEIGAKAAEYIINKLEDGNSPYTSQFRLVISPELKIRESTL